MTVAANFLHSGSLVAIPTETVYGLAGNALNPAAVARIFEVKNRPTFNPLIVHTDTWAKLQPYVREVPKLAEQLAEQCWPGPLTLLLPRTSRIPDLVTAGLDRVAVRIPQHPLTQRLLAKVAFPLAAPSANPSGYVSPTEAAHVAEQLGSQIPYILDGGTCSVGIESTIVGFAEDKLVVYRWGGLSAEQLQKTVGRAVAIVPHTVPADTSPSAPGMLKSHYAPRQRVIVGNLPSLITRYPTDRVAVLSFQKMYSPVPAARHVVLSPFGNLAEAAQRLFAALRQLEKLPVDYILTEMVPNEGLGRAVNDRLLRAAAEK